MPLKGLKTFLPQDLNPEIGVITGTRPGVIMAAPIFHELAGRSAPHFIIHSDQHYSTNMDSLIFEDLGLSQPHYRLQGVRDKLTHGAQTAAMLEGIEKILIERRPSVMLIFGDTNSNLAAALAARKLNIAVAHVEAGERCHEWRRPEEQNRKMIDVVSGYLLVTGPKAAANLRREGIPDERIIETGNPIVDASLQNIERARRVSDILDRLGLAPGQYAVMTMHREQNVDWPEPLKNGLLGATNAAAKVGLDKLVFPAHPRTIKRLKEFGLWDWALSLPRLQLTEALGFLDFLRLLADSALAFTDSGGVAQESCIHHVRCVSLVQATEWTEPVEAGAQIMAGNDPDKIVAAAEKLIQTQNIKWGFPFGQGDAAKRIVNLLYRHIGLNG